MQLDSGIRTVSLHQQDNIQQIIHKAFQGIC